MFRDDRLEYKNGTLQLKPEIPGAILKNDKKPRSRRTTRFDFSGTNYETCTRGHMSCLETMLAADPELIEDICKHAKELAGVRKSLLRDDDDDNDSKYATLQTDPEFLARASLFQNLKGKKSNSGRARATHKDNLDKEESKARGSNDGDIDGSNEYNDVNGNELEGNDSNY